MDNKPNYFRHRRNELLILHNVGMREEGREKMDSTKITLEFEKLLNEIKIYIDELNQHGAQSFFMSNYDATKEILIKIDKANLLKEKIKSLNNEWEEIVGPLEKKKTTEPAKNKQVEKKIITKDIRTKPIEFEIPILEALDSLGGSSDIHDVMDIVEQSMKNALSEFDWQTIPSDKNMIRWKNNVQWARLNLVKKGYLSDKSPKGIWEITEAGKSYFEASKKK